MPRTTMLALTAIAVSSPACSSHERWAVRQPAISGEQLNEKAWRILERIDLGAVADAARAIEELKTCFPGDRRVPAMQVLLAGWLDRKRQVPHAPTSIEAAAGGTIGKGADDPASGPSLQLSIVAAEALKEEGIQLYSEGRVAAALDCWRRVLAARPDDEEARKLMERAETVLSNQGAQQEP